MSDANLLERLQYQVADRAPIDWEALDRQVLTPDEVEQVLLLQLLEAIGSAHSTFQTSDEFAESSGDAPERRAEFDEGDVLTTWGRYRLDETIGRGGFGTVYRAWDPELEMPVAIKILHKGHSLLHEGRLLGQLKHPNIVRVLNVEQHGERHGLVMELLRGDTLDSLVTARGVFNDREATVIAEDVCRALATVHASDLIHRDVKARNILRERAGRIVLMDFGTGLRADDVDDAGRVVGTLPYMAPELLLGQPASVASDVYGVGVLIFFLVTGRHPFEASSADGFRAAHARGTGLSLLELRPDLPAPFVTVVQRALAQEPRDRFGSAAALLQALGRARDTRVDRRKWLTRAAIASAALLVGLTAAGMLSSAAFNASLERSDFTTESFLQWFTVGRKSLLMPLVLVLLSVGLIGLAGALRRMAVTASSRARAADRAIANGCDRVARRLVLYDPTVSSSWLIVLSVAAAGAVWMYWAPLLLATGTSVSTASREMLALLSPAFADYQTAYRQALTLLAAANLALWYSLMESSRARGIVMPAWLKAAELAIVVLLIGAMQIPYRLIYDNNEFEAVFWNDLKCYEIGQREEKRLLFCPSLMPRNRIVSGTEVTPASAKKSQADGAEKIHKESLFMAFSP
jgi:hypothetical protein